MNVRRCPKCGRENAESARFCSHCHMTLRFTCPSCQHVQLQGGSCEECGVDLVKYAMMMQFQLESQVRREREEAKSRHALLKQAFLLPVTGGWSLLKYLKSIGREE